QVIGEGSNRPIAAADPTAHAEIQALRAAGLATGNYRFPGAVLYVTLEPCMMCLGALVHARVAEIVFAAEDPKSGVLGSASELADGPWLNHRCASRGGLLADEAAELLRAFFRARR
ncbi:MAG: deaminase, partial [Pseudomonadota bacterium]